MTPDQARQYLAELGASEQWKAVKPLAEYKDAQVVRKARDFQRQEHAGLAISNRAARGHTSERGKTMEGAKHYRAIRAPKGVEATVHHGKKDITSLKAHDERSAMAAVHHVERLSPATQVTVSYKGRDGQHHTIYSKGVSAEALEAKISASGGFGGMVAAVAAGIYEDDDDAGEFDDYDPEFQVMVL